MINNRPVTYKILWIILSLIAGVFLSLFIIYETSVNKEYYGTVPPWVAILISTLSAVANLFVIMQSSLAIKIVLWNLSVHILIQ